MSASDSLHYQLCCECAKWLRNRKNSERWETPWKYIAVELNVYGTENADVWATNGWSSIVVEVKTSRSDFHADFKKKYRSETWQDQVPGNYRYFLVPKGLVSPDELPDGHGLLEWEDGKIVRTKAATYRKVTNRADIIYLCSILRREGFPQKIYNYRGAPTTIRPKQSQEWMDLGSDKSLLGTSGEGLPVTNLTQEPNFEIE